ncbi:hypothetical protein [Fimbriiglobus ruber]|uniref:Uncharacterized protein n=1 Tax=Fimbriiglobus ruber TaxID=1908690 RepID=A0A225DLS0_9BACT|nr:hypothetical protein [Fimbriiglobus ruber]OWK42322.1 hypothetical protein FRUB_04400 [Fimbriiglobus ruber]
MTPDLPFIKGAFAGRASGGFSVATADLLTFFPRVHIGTLHPSPPTWGKLPLKCG